MSRPKKFNFSKILFNGGSAEKLGDPSALISKNGQLVINKAANHKYGLDGAFVDITWDDEKRALGWRRIKGFVPPEKDWTRTNKLLKADPKGAIKVSIGRIMTAVGIEKANYKGLLVEEYNDAMEHNTIYYVLVPKLKKDENTK